MKKVIIGFTILLVSSTSCFNEVYDNNNTDIEIIKKLYLTFKNGEIDECQYKGQTVYVAGINAYDAGSAIYDQEGTIIGSCNYAWGEVDEICSQLTDCEVIFRCDDHISGEPPVDIYGLSE